MDNNIGRGCANLLWILHNVDLECRYWQDAELRDRVLYPLLVGVVNYRHFLVEKPDGLLHLPSNHSPELRNVEDCSYDLDLLRWGVGRLLELADEKGLSSGKEPLVPIWKDIQTRLVPTHVNETGRMCSLPDCGVKERSLSRRGASRARRRGSSLSQKREVLSKSELSWRMPSGLLQRGVK